MNYTDGQFHYGMEQLIWKHSEEWSKILFNVLKVKIALLYKEEKRVKPKEIDIEREILDVVNDAIPIFDKYLINIKGYEKYPVIDMADGTDIELIQKIDYKVLLCPFQGFFDMIEVR